MNKTQSRIDNIRNAEKANKKYFRRTRIHDYLAGQAIYCLGDYPARVDAAPTDYDRELIKTLAESGVQLIQVHEEWNDAVRLYGADKYNAVNRQGMKDFVELCHSYGIKIIAYVSSGFIHEYDPDYTEDFSAKDAYSTHCTGNYFKYRKGNHGNALWRDYIIPKTLYVMDEYGFDGIFNDWGYDYTMLPNFEVPDCDIDVEDMFSIIYGEIKKRGGIYKLHCDWNHQPPCRDKVGDYLWIGESVVGAPAGTGKDYDLFVVPCQDRHKSDAEKLEPYMAKVIPFMQFPLMKTGRPIIGKNIDLPGVTYYGGGEYNFYKAVGEYMDEHPDGPYVYSLWSSIPDDVDEFDVWTKYFKLYKPMVEESSVAYIELRECDEIKSEIPEKVYASMFVNEEMYLVVSNLDDGDYELKLDGSWQDRVSGEVGDTFVVEPGKIRFFVKM